MQNRSVLKVTFAGIAAMTVPIAIGMMNGRLASAQFITAPFETASRSCNEEPGMMKGAGANGPRWFLVVDHLEKPAES
jgi:hypothetical protein